ncbi:eyes absent 2-like isoform X2 [Tripterygium wilfordii]|uniref:protein-tyrosine-phosphatase n=1 Tax=Tripterygium wilfordii TaxID=458696 RepID=A0A7J7CM19_TRIWF|nr:eyes absent 2-like isoform X2 [Tripterygium wilfordii]
MGIVNVYMGDMDETLILLKSLLNGTYVQPFNGLKDVKKGVEIGKMWENYILQICDDFPFYEQIENYNNPHLDSFSQYDDGLDLRNYDFNQESKMDLLLHMMIATKENYRTDTEL